MSGCRDGRKVRNRTMLALAGITVALAVCALPAHAHAAAVFSAPNPSVDSTVPGAPSYISVYVDDSSAILQTTTMTINGASVPVTLDWPGHWADPDCQENWVVDDWTAATISTPGRVLKAEGTYVVEVTVRTQSSGTSTYSWSFTIEYPPDSAATFWSMLPTANTTVTAPVALSSWTASPNGLSYGSSTFYLDDVARTTYLTAGGGGTMRAYTSSFAPADGTRTVRLAVMDVIGVYTEKVWTFGVAIKPTLSAPTPIGGASYTGVRPPIGLTIADNTPGQVHLRLVVDGAVVFDGMTNQGAFRWNPDYDLASGVNHTVASTITDSGGNVSTLDWEFKNEAMFAYASPAAESTIGGTPGQVSVYLDAASEILNSARMWVDGVPVSAAVEWVGHYEDPDCEAVWVVDDWTAATISAPSGVLAEGEHTVRVEVDTVSEGTLSHEWAFAIEYAPGSEATFANRDPVPGSTVTGYPTLKVTVMNSTPISRSGISAYVDGTKVPCSTSSFSSTNQIVYVSPVYFTSQDGTHTVRITALSSAGVLSQDTWSFQTQIKPTLAGQYPTTAVPARTARPQIGVMVADNAPGELRVRFKLDGVTQFDGQVAQGLFRYTPPVDFENNSTHSVVVDVWDAAGNASTLTWSFDVIAAPAMSDAGSCVACHPAYPGAHPFTNCSGCHADDPLYDPHESNRFAPLGACWDCHGSSYNHPSSSVANCTWCHTSEIWLQIPRHETSPATAHETTRTGCTPCHDSNLVTEHAKHPVDSPFKSQCSTCHLNEDAAVTASIAGHITDCYACHPGDPHHEPADLSAQANDGPQCSVCHSGLTQDHLASTSSSAVASCDACHAPGGAREGVVGAWDRSCDTSGCHSSGSGREVHTNYCLACHDVNQADFSVAKTAFPPVASVDRETACVRCHLPGLAGAHPYHQIGANCGAACHPAWGPSLLSATPIYNDPSSGASFSSAASTATPASVLHVIHSQARWPAGVSTSFSACASCHAVAACNACHTGAIPGEHATHSSVGSTGYPAVEPWTGTVGYGVVGGDQTQHTDAVREVQCGAQGCHDLSATADSAPGIVQDYNHAAGGNPEDPGSTSTAITFEGTWRTRWNTKYSGGRMSFANSTAALLTAGFSGARVEILSDKDPYRGRAEVLVDGVVVGTFDGYAPVTTTQVTVFSANVGPGLHTISVRPLGTGHASARATFVVVDGFRVYQELPSGITPACTGCHADRGATHW